MEEAGALKLLQAFVGLAVDHNDVVFEPVRRGALLREEGGGDFLNGFGGALAGVFDDEVNLLQGRVGVGVVAGGLVEFLAEKMLFGVEEFGADFLAKLAGQFGGGVGGERFAFSASGGGVLFSSFEGLLETGEKRLAPLFEFDLFGVAVSVEDIVGEALFHCEGFEHAVFDGALGDEVDDLDGLFLAFAPGAGDALFELGGIPGEVAVDDDAGVLQVEAGSAGFGAEDDFAVGILFESLDFETALFLRNFAGVPGVADLLGNEMLADQSEHADPFREDDDLGFGVLKGGVEDFDEFVEFGRDARFLVEDELGVAEHPHAAQGSHETLVFFGSEGAFFGEVHKASDGFSVSTIVGFLAFSEVDEAVFVGAVGEFGFDLGLAAAENDGSDFCA